MSKRFLTKVAGGVALGSAALLLGAPATALAYPAPEAESEDTVQVYSHKRGDKKGDKKRDHKRDHKREQNTFYVKDRGGEIYTCQLVEQDSEAKVRNVIGDVDLSGSSNTTVTVIPITPAIAPNVNLTGLVICFRDIDVDLTADVDVDLGLLDGLPPINGGILAQPFQANGTGGLGISSLLSLGWLEELFRSGLSVTADGVIIGGGGGVLPPGNGNGNGNGLPPGNGNGNGLANILPAGGVAAGDGGALSSNAGTLAAAGAGLMGVAALGGMGLLRRRSANGTVA